MFCTLKLQTDPPSASVLIPHVADTANGVNGGYGLQFWPFEMVPLGQTALIQSPDWPEPTVQHHMSRSKNPHRLLDHLG